MSYFDCQKVSEMFNTSLENASFNDTPTFAQIMLVLQIIIVLE